MSTRGAEPPAKTRRAVHALLHALCMEHGISPVPTLEWSSRMRRLLGRADVWLNRVRLSAWLDDEQAADTLRHELAHIAVGEWRGRQAHGPRWRAWARRLGTEPRAAARGAPAHGPAERRARQHTGLECPGCGARFVRVRVLRGLYCQACGPRSGRLARVLRGEREAVLAWASERA